jgi:hypothetical protein
MISVVDKQRDILLSPTGTNVWSGQVLQSLNSATVTWSLARQLYGPHGPYLIIPTSLVIGMVPTVVQWLIWKVTHFTALACQTFHELISSDGRGLDLSKSIRSCFLSSTWSARCVNSFKYLLKQISSTRQTCLRVSTLPSHLALL